MGVMRGGFMSDSIQISSTANPRVKQVVKLRQRRERDTTGLFLIEGYRELLRAAESEFPVKELFICPELYLGENEDSLIQRIQKIAQGQCAIRICTPTVFQKLSYRDRPDGLLAIASQLPCRLNLLPQPHNPLYLVAEAIEKPGNLGTILRSSDASGVDGVIVCDRCTDLHNPNVVRASIGTLFTVPVAEASSQETLEFLRQQKVQILAATPAAKADYSDVDLTGPVAVLMGTEQLGLTDFWMNEADLQVRIPMMGKADSLNVATATTVLLFEALRQRRKHESQGSLPR